MLTDYNTYISYNVFEIAKYYTISNIALNKLLKNSIKNI